MSGVTVCVVVCTNRAMRVPTQSFTACVFGSGAPAPAPTGGGMTPCATPITCPRVASSFRIMRRPGSASISYV